MKGEKKNEIQLIENIPKIIGTSSSAGTFEKGDMKGKRKEIKKEINLNENTPKISVILYARFRERLLKIRVS